MRRRMFWQQDFIRYLKSIGCKLYFPFDNKYQLDAAIGNTSVVTYYGSYFMYDANVDMAQSVTRQLNYVIASIDTNFTEEDFPTNEWTLFSQAMRNNKSGEPSGTSNVFRVASSGIYDIVQICQNENLTAWTENWEENTKYSTFSLINKDNNVVDFCIYKPDKTLAQRQAAAIAYSKPTTQQRYNAFAGNSSQVNKRVYIGHMMIFNRKLTDKEMKKIIDYLL